MDSDLRPVADGAVPAGAVVSGAVPDRPTLEGLEDTWARRWAKERVVQV